MMIRVLPVIYNLYIIKDLGFSRAVFTPMCSYFVSRGSPVLIAVLDASSLGLKPLIESTVSNY